MTVAAVWFGAQYPQFPLLIKLLKYTQTNLIDSNVLVYHDLYIRHNETEKV